MNHLEFLNSVLKHMMDSMSFIMSLHSFWCRSVDVNGEYSVSKSFLQDSTTCVAQAMFLISDIFLQCDECSIACICIYVVECRVSLCAWFSNMSYKTNNVIVIQAKYFLFFH